MFHHKHPYAPFIFHDTEKLIVGTLPPPRFSTGELLPKDVDFCYGSYFNSLWLYLDRIFDLNLTFDNSDLAIDERKRFLKQRKIGVCDIVDSCQRSKIDASDLGMQNIVTRDMVNILRTHDSVKMLLFIGGNSKNGPEYLFRKHLKSNDMELEPIDLNTPRIHEFQLDDRYIKTVSLTSSSGAANISIGSLDSYKKLKAVDPEFNTFEFRVMQYSEFFLSVDRELVSMSN